MNSLRRELVRLGFEPVGDVEYLIRVNDALHDVPSQGELTFTADALYASGQVLAATVHCDDDDSNAVIVFNSALHGDPGIGGWRIVYEGEEDEIDRRAAIVRCLFAHGFVDVWTLDQLFEFEDDEPEALRACQGLWLRPGELILEGERSLCWVRHPPAVFDAAAIDWKSAESFDCLADIPLFAEPKE